MKHFITYRIEEAAYAFTFWYTEAEEIKQHQELKKT